MKTVTALEVNLVSRSVWEPMLEAAFAQLPASWARFGRATLARVHDRHVGISPQLVAQLVPMLMKPDYRPSQDNPWSAVYERLQAELSVQDSRSRRPGRQRYGLLWHANPSYCVMRMVIPLMARADESLGFRYLFSEAEVPSGVSKEAYEQHAQALTAALLALADENGSEHQLFWRELAMTLAHFSRPGGDAGSHLPQNDPVSLGMLLRLSPQIVETRKENTRFRQVASREKQHRASRLREGGVDGIQLTRRPEDLDSILLSEFTNPDFILTDRLLNTGFFSLQRNPRRERMRDVLLVGLMPRDSHQDIVRDFVKACWFECLMRLSIRLRRTGIQHSAFRWFESDPLGRTRRCDFNLDDLPMLQAPPMGQPTPKYRNEFLNALRWVPNFLDTTAGTAQTHGEPIYGNPEQRLERMKQWAFKACGQVADDDYSHVHLMLFLPSGDERTLSHNITPLLRGFWPGLQEGRHVSVTWLPKSLNDAGGWAFDGRGQSRHHPFEAGVTTVGEQELARCLIRLWIDQLDKEIWRA